jgi:XapX domain-containing protein
VSKIIAGMMVGLGIGTGCRWFDIPLPDPLKLVGAVSLVSVTVGRVATDKLITTRFSAKGPAVTQVMCGGPGGCDFQVPFLRLQCRTACE